MLRSCLRHHSPTCIHDCSLVLTRAHVAVSRNQLPRIVVVRYIAKMHNGLHVGRARCWTDMSSLSAMALASSQRCLRDCLGVVHKP